MAEPFPTLLGGINQAAQSTPQLLLMGNQLQMQKKQMENQWTERKVDTFVKLLENKNLPKETRKMLWGQFRPVLSAAAGIEIPEYNGEPPSDFFKRLQEIENSGMSDRDKQKSTIHLLNEYPDNKEELLKMADIHGEMAKSADALEKEKRERGIKSASDLRQEFISQSKDFATVSSAYNRIVSIGNNATAGSDMALIFSLMKLYDPGSTVREGEYATAEKARGVPESIRATYNKILSGEKLTPEQRQDFLNTADGVYAGQDELHSQREAEYRRLAVQQGADPSNVIIEIRAKRPARKEGAPSAGAPAAPKAEEKPKGMVSTASGWLKKWGVGGGD